MGTFEESLKKSFGKKTGNALGNVLYGKASDDKRISLRTEGGAKKTSVVLEQEKLRSERQEARLENERRMAEMEQENKENERHLDRLEDIRTVSFSATDINENVTILSQLIALLAYDEDNNHDFFDGDSKDQIRQKQVISTAVNKIKTGLAISKGIDPTNGVIIALEQEFNDALNAVNERDAKNKSKRNTQRILFAALYVVLLGLLIWGVVALIDLF